MCSAFAPSAGISTSSSFVVPNRISSLQAATNDYGLGMPLSPADVKRIGEMRERIVTIPILIMDTTLPGQAVEFSRCVVCGVLNYFVIYWRLFHYLLFMPNVVVLKCLF